MNTQITGRHMEMTDALKSYIQHGLDKLTSHFDRVIEADVVLDVEKRRHIAEINLHANGVRIHGKEESPDMYSSVDAVLAKLEKQVKKYKDRINRHQPRTSREARDYGHAILSIPEYDESQPGNGHMQAHQVVKSQKLPMRPMTVEEAMMQLDLIDDVFIVFSNAETSQVNVLYKRDDGNYGLIEPQY
jgi:putative sigma-54 modulation protein